MVFHKIIRAVVTAFFPTNDRLALVNMITNPIKAHVDGFGLFLFDSVIGNAGGSAVVGLDGGGGLGVAYGNSSRVVRNGHASLPLWNNAANSASTALAKTLRVTVQRT
jgi:hypothetical protein